MNKIISILDIVHDTTVDGPGFRTTIYAAGCAHRCLECHNPQSWDKNNGILHSTRSLLDDVKKSDFANVTFSGGDPLMQVDAFTELARLIRIETNKTIWCYTGFVYEQVIRSPKYSQILPYIDVLVDGPYIHTLNDESLRFRGSSNQRLIDVQASLKNDRLTLWNDGLYIEFSQLYSQCKGVRETASF